MKKCILIAGMIIGALSSSAWGMDGFSWSYQPAISNLNHYFAGKQHIPVNEYTAQNVIYDRAKMYAPLAAQILSSPDKKRLSCELLTALQHLVNYKELIPHPFYGVPHEEDDDAALLRRTVAKVENTVQQYSSLATWWQQLFRNIDITIYDEPLSTITFPALDAELEFANWVSTCWNSAEVALMGYRITNVISFDADTQKNIPNSARLIVLKLFAHIAHALPSAARSEFLLRKGFEDAQVDPYYSDLISGMLCTLASKHEEIMSQTANSLTSEKFLGYFSALKNKNLNYDLILKKCLPQAWQRCQAIKTTSIESSFCLPHLTKNAEDFTPENWPESRKLIEEKLGEPKIRDVLKHPDCFSKTDRCYVLKLYAHVAHAIPNHIYADRAACVKFLGEEKCYEAFGELGKHHDEIQKAFSIEEIEQCVDKHFTLCNKIAYKNLGDPLGAWITLWHGYKPSHPSGSKNKHSESTSAWAKLHKPTILALGAAGAAGILATIYWYSSAEDESTHEDQDAT